MNTKSRIGLVFSQNVWNSNTTGSALHKDVVVSFTTGKWPLIVLCSLDCVISSDVNPSLFTENSNVLRRFLFSFTFPLRCRLHFREITVHSYIQVCYLLISL